LGSHDSRWYFRPHKVYFFELSTKFKIKSSPKTLKLVNTSRESEKGAKNSYGSYPTEFVFEVKKLTPVIPFPSVIPEPEVSYLKGSFKKWEEKTFHLNSHEIPADSRATDFFFRTNGYFSDKKS
jgi:hypothetical protein